MLEGKNKFQNKLRQSRMGKIIEIGLKKWIGKQRYYWAKQESQIGHLKRLMSKVQKSFARLT